MVIRSDKVISGYEGFLFFSSVRFPSTETSIYIDRPWRFLYPHRKNYTTRFGFSNWFMNRIVCVQGVRGETHFFYSIECVIRSEWWYTELYSGCYIGLQVTSFSLWWHIPYIHSHTYRLLSFNKFYRETSWKSFPHFGSLCNIRSLHTVDMLWPLSPNFSIHNKCLMLLHIVQKVLGCDDVVKLILVEVYAKK